MQQDSDSESSTVQDHQDRERSPSILDLIRVAYPVDLTTDIEQEHIQTFTPILELETVSSSPDTIPPQHKKLKRDRSLSPSCRLTVPYFVEHQEQR